MSSIIDNRQGNTLQLGIERITGGSRELSIATAYFSLNALALIAKNLDECDSVRILFGDQADKTQRSILLAKLRETSDEELERTRFTDPTLSDLSTIEKLFAQNRIQARCYTAKKFHAKAYYVKRIHHPNAMGILGSGNFTGPGLTQNIELNVELSPEQTTALGVWFDERWDEAVKDDVTAEVRAEVKRQIELYDPHVIYQRALLAWGDWVQGREMLPEIGILSALDPHQEDAYRQALKIIARERGVLISDGVGLGKSYVALALMEHFLARGKRAFLIAPKAILTASWEGDLTRYLDQYRRGYSSLVHEPMTWFGYDPKRTDPATASKTKELEEFARQAEVIVIDESHNFRKTDSSRYVNLLKMLQEGPLGPKTVILLSATPINTEYKDLSAQFRLITQEKGHIGGLRIEQYQKAAIALDRAEPKKESDQLELEFVTKKEPTGVLSHGLQSVAIQRSRRTCKELAAAHGKVLRFPEREPIQTVEYTLSPLFAEVVSFAGREFTELAKFLSAYRNEVSRASKAEGKARQIKVKLPERGLRFSAYLPDRYKRHPDDSLRDAQVESFLVSLVFVNVMKQLESSPVAFQGIVQALGAGLCARLTHMANRSELDSEQVSEAISKHTNWIGSDLNAAVDTDDGDDESDDGVASDSSGEEMDEWLVNALRVNNVRKGLEKFSSATHDVLSWRKHIETDLDILKGIHERLVAARTNCPDQKLEDILARLRLQRQAGRKALVFTQSRRTAQYLERELTNAFGNEVARIDASVQGDRRAAILHAFSPRYNPLMQPPLQFNPVNTLISTDVLSEGVNLQESGCILNYDIHWNPVRLIQRIGRVDRRLREDDPGHTFAILNVHPPKEIEDIIDLVATVENRKRKITSLFGLDQSFLTASDPEGTLNEFNAKLEGVVTARDEALKAYDILIHQHPAEVAVAESLPPGGFGVWSNAPVNGMFAAFVMTVDDNKISDKTRDKFRGIIDMPVMAMEADGKLILDPSEILAILANTMRGERSGDPGESEELLAKLCRLRKEAYQSLRNADLVIGIRAQLVCWMELRKA